MNLLTKLCTGSSSLRTPTVLLPLILWLVINLDVCNCDPETDSAIYHNQFAVLIPKGPETADQLAAAHGFVNLGQIGALENYFLFENARIQKRSTEQSNFHGDMLAVEPDVAWYRLLNSFLYIFIRLLDLNQICTFFPLKIVFDSVVSNPFL